MPKHEEKEEKMSPLQSPRDTRIVMTHIVTHDDLYTGGSASARTQIRDGLLLRLMDICACGSAEKFSSYSSVTLSMDDLVFHNPELAPGTVVVVQSQVNCAWGTSMEIGAICEAEDLWTGEKSKICRAYFTFVSLNEGKKVRLPKLAVTEEEDLRRHIMAGERRKLRFQRASIISSAAPVPEQQSQEGGQERTGTTSPEPDHKANTPTTLVMTEIVLPPHANHQGNTFGGQVMSWMAKAAHIVACRYARGADSVHVMGIDDVFFLQPSAVGDRIEIKAVVTHCWGNTMEVELEVHAYNLSGVRRMINRAFWWLGAESSQNEQFAVKQVDCSFSPTARVAFEEAQGRRALRVERYAIGRDNPSWEWKNELAGDLIRQNLSQLLDVFWGSRGSQWVHSPDASTDDCQLYVRESTRGEGRSMCLKITAILEGIRADAALQCIITRRVEWDVFFHAHETLQQIDDHNEVQRLVFQVPGSPTLTDFTVLSSWRSDPVWKVFASHSIMSESLAPEEEAYSRGTVGTSGWVIRQGENHSELTYILTLGSSGMQSLGSVARATLVGRSKMVSANIGVLRQLLLQEEQKGTQPDSASSAAASTAPEKEA